MIIPKRVIFADYDGTIDVSGLREVLSKLTFKECSAAAEESWGFTGVDEFDERSDQLMILKDFALMNIRRDYKKIKKTKLSRAWKAEIAKKEKADGIRLDKVARDELREKVRAEMLKDIDPHEQYIKLALELSKSRLYVMSSVPADADFAVSKLNQALSTQGVSIPFSPELPPTLEMTLTQWVATPSAADEFGFEVGEDMQLKGQEASSATLRKQPVETAEVREHLHGGKSVQKVKLRVKESGVSFQVSSALVLSQIDLKPVCKDQLKEEREKHDDVAAAKEAEGLIWLSELSDLVTRVETIPVQ
ncbi:recombination-associated protein RdgC [Marinobacterium stanieri]|uniref:Recombination-associated protein RdgC n=1 Tax=Marinobacterium stanieri TaxID=49186 RepID=A0A1N6XHV3_9GAMM|nr:recombination-associated protein RdgC [Marinobacterium stanieri]SIR01850.1 DNA recombination-dependent growth factor C [Marinobacterium stanieri]